MHRHNGIYTLLPGAATGYYEQVQGTLAVTGKVHCDFVIWTMTGMLVIPVKFDGEFWANAEHQLQMFFEKYVVAEILTECVWRALPLSDGVFSAILTTYSTQCCQFRVTQHTQAYTGTQQVTYHQKAHLK